MKRRVFIRNTALGSAAILTTTGFQTFAQGSNLNIGLIGSGWYGMVITRAALKAGGVEVIAVSDVDTEHLSASADELEKLQGSRPKLFKDYRDLLELQNLDAIMIGTPPHWHALIFIAACKKGVDIYCEKPLAYDVDEGKAMVNAAKEAGNIVQIGFQRRQSAAFKKAQELIENGTTGRIRQIEAQINYNPPISDLTVQDPPASLDWDNWCGPAPKLEYTPNIGHKAWRLEKEYGNGHLVDWGIHHIDIIRRIMRLEMPVSFNSVGELDFLKGKITTPDMLNVTMEFEQCPVFWKHRLWGPGDINSQFNNGIFFYGEKATLFASDNKLVLMPAGPNQNPQEINLPSPDMQDNHVIEFINAVKSKNKNTLSCTVEDGYQSTSMVQLAMASWYSGSKVVWNASNGFVTNNESAAKLLNRPYRAGYSRPVI